MFILALSSLLSVFIAVLVDRKARACYLAQSHRQRLSFLSHFLSCQLGFFLVLLHGGQGGCGEPEFHP